MLSDPSNPWAPWVFTGAEHLLDRYLAETPLARPAVAKRLVLYTGTWLLMAAVQQRSVDMRPEADQEAALLVSKAAATFRACRSVIGQLIGTPMVGAR